MNNRLLPQPLGQVRIISGRWRGRKLAVLTEQGLRPTSHRLRETLFNWLAPMLLGASVLDCFAGSGALGLEALSRDASYLRLLERNPLVAKQLGQALQRLESHAATVLTVDSRVYLAQPADRRFNLVFLDPPFYQALPQALFIQLERYQWLAEEAWIYLETEAEWRPNMLPNHWQLYREIRSRQVAYRLYRRHPIRDDSSTPLITL
jgi:16S rRNA (guanine966-N2)-methyltransferase